MKSPQFMRVYKLSYPILKINFALGWVVTASLKRLILERARSSSGSGVTRPALNLLFKF